MCTLPVLEFDPTLKLRCPQVSFGWSAETPSARAWTFNNEDPTATWPGILIRRPTIVLMRTHLLIRRIKNAMRILNHTENATLPNMVLFTASGTITELQSPTSTLCINRILSRASWHKGRHPKFDFLCDLLLIRHAWYRLQKWQYILLPKFHEVLYRLTKCFPTFRLMEQLVGQRHPHFL